MKNIRITHDIPVLPSTLGLTHTATDWQISLYPDFSDTTKMLVQSLKDTTNLNSYAATLDIDNDTAVYVRVRYYFGTKVSNWSRVAQINGDQKGFKLSNTIVATPRITIKLDYTLTTDGEFIISTTPFEMHTGSGSHQYTTWEIYDTDGNAVYKRSKDSEFLTELRIRGSLLDPYKAYEIRVTHISSTNMCSNYGRLIYNESIKTDRFYKLIPINPIIVNSRQYFNLQLFTTAYSSIDIIVLDKDGNVVNSNYTQKTVYPYVDLNNIISNELYTIKARVHLTTGLVTDYDLVWSGISKAGATSTYDSSKSYLGKQSYVNDLITNGITVQSSTQLINGTILFTKQNSNKIYTAQYDGSTFTIGPVAIELPVDDILGIPYLSVTPLYNGKVLISYSIENPGTKYHDMIFKLYDHNIVTDTFSLINTLALTDMQYSPAATASIIPYLDNNVYFIPYTETLNGGNVDLSLYMLDTTTFLVNKVTELPFKAKCGVSLASDVSNNLYILGGSDIQDSGLPTDRTNNNIYRYDVGKKVMTNFATLPTTISPGIHTMQCYMRADGNIVCFNSVSSGISLGNQNTFVIDTKTGNITIESSDTTDNLPYRVTISLANGDFLRISSRISDPQTVYLYVSNTITADKVKVDTVTLPNITDIVVNANEVVTIETLLGVNSITIKGTSSADTGILRWLSNDSVVNFDYKDLIIFDNKTLTQQLANDGGWRSYNVINGKTLTITG
jgi:hypothetical protein